MTSQCSSVWLVIQLSVLPALNYEHPVVDPHVSHFKHVPLRTSVKFPQVPQASPSSPLAWARVSARVSCSSVCAGDSLGSGAAFSAVEPETSVRGASAVTLDAAPPL